MAPSQLKQLKASIHERRQASGKRKQQPPLNSESRNGQKTQPKKRPKSQGEQNRRLTLLPELQRRNKVGGIIDRRIGENDPTMAPEERALQRYTRQRSKRDSLFNLEEDDGEDELTHLGRSVLSGMDSNVRDDFEDSGAGSSGEEDDEFMGRAKKRRRFSEDDVTTTARDDALEDEPERKKSKQEVMKEVIAKSKLYKYERQQAKDEDEDVREALNKDLPDLLAALRGNSAQSKPAPVERGPTVHPDRAAQISEDLNARKPDAEKEYDQRLRQMAQDKRAQPTERTKTAEEKAEAEATRLRELEERRIRRMKGEELDSDHENDVEEEDYDDNIGDIDVRIPEGKSTMQMDKPPMDVEDEDDFIIDEDLVASGSDIDDDVSDESSSANADEVSDDDEEFLRDVRPLSNGDSGKDPVGNTTSSALPYTYACPQSHSELLDVFKGVPHSDLFIVIQRIRALYHPQLNSQNSERLSNFAIALVDHLSFLASEKASLGVVENLIRHIHSLSRKYADATARAFRSHLRQMQVRFEITTGDLFILTAIGSIYPTSDHFHPIVTPAITIMARWLAMVSPKTDQQLRIGAYLVGLSISYQKRSKRYVPEAVRFTLNALKRHPKAAGSKSHIKNLVHMMDLWSAQPAFIEIFTPAALEALNSTEDGQAIQKLRILLSQSQLRRRPLELHHHRPLPIRSAIPKFEEGFNPDKHYDPDRERAEANKLRKEYKREKKGALRELRKDANFIAREKLKAKKEADRAYEIKQRRLIAEIQGEEGMEKNAYEREKRKRKGIR